MTESERLARERLRNGGSQYHTGLIVNPANADSSHSSGSESGYHTGFIANPADYAQSSNGAKSWEKSSKWASQSEVSECFMRKK